MDGKLVDMEEAYPETEGSKGVMVDDPTLEALEDDNHEV